MSSQETLLTPSPVFSSGARAPAVLAAGAGTRSLANTPWGTIARRSVTPILLIVLWQFASYAGWVSPAVLAPPSQVWATFIELSRTGEILAHIGISLQRVMLGLAIGGSVAVVLGVAAGLSRFGEDTIDPPL